MSRQSFVLGRVCPRGCPSGPSLLRAECLIEGVEPSIEVAVRFDQVVERELLNAAGEPVEELIVTGHRYSSGNERVAGEVRLTSLPNRTAVIRTAGSERAELTEDAARAGCLVWCWEPLHGTVEAWTEEIRPGLHRVRVEVANRLEWNCASDGRNPLRMLRSTQVVMSSPNGVFTSIDAPQHHAAATATGNAA